MAKIGSFSSLFNLQSNSINFNFGDFWPKYQGYSLTFWPKLAHFHHFSICNQNQSISISVIFGQTTKAIALLFGQNWLIFITFNLQSKSINFNFGHFWPKYQGYSLTFWPKLAHFHHFSICNQNQSISISVIFGQNTKAIALLFGQNWLIFITFSICNQTQSISMSVIFGQNTKAIALLFGQNWLIFHHFSICNQTQSISISVIFGQNTKAIALLFGQNWLISSLFNLQSNSINFNFGHFWPKYQGYSLTFWPKLAQFHHFSICNQTQSISISVIFGQNTKAIALLFGQNWLIFITFQSAIKLNQFQFR